MFHSAVLKLTAWYVGALVLVCLVFSLPVYNIASARLQHGAERQTDVVRRLPDPFIPDDIVSQLNRQRDRQLADDRKELLTSIILTNLVIITVGAVASYAFARRTLEPIEEAHAAQVSFTANASHELRTPLAVMQTEIEVALRSKNLSQAQTKEILTSNLEEVARLRQLSDQLLGLTRVDAKPLKLSKVNLGKLVQEQMSLLARRHGITITTEAAKNVFVMADALLLAQVYGIIVDNAVAYSGLPDPAIVAKLTSSGDQAVLSISNKGKAIATKDLEHIFDRFYRGTDASTSNPKGHGLGLALAKNIIERHDGTLTAISTSAKGTIFTITTPKTSS